MHWRDLRRAARQFTRKSHAANIRILYRLGAKRPRESFCDPYQLDTAKAVHDPLRLELPAVVDCAIRIFYPTQSTEGKTHANVAKQYLTKAPVDDVVNPSAKRNAERFVWYNLFGIWDKDAHELWASDGHPFCSSGLVAVCYNLMTNRL